jgi:hypothetical protein
MFHYNLILRGPILFCFVAMSFLSTLFLTRLISLQHDASIKQVSWIADMNVAVTGSWDKTLRVWDARAPQAQATMQVCWCHLKINVFFGSCSCLRSIFHCVMNGFHLSTQLSERVYCMDAISNLLVVGTADKKIAIYDLRQYQAPKKVRFISLHFFFSRPFLESHFVSLSCIPSLAGDRFAAQVPAAHHRVLPRSSRVRGRLDRGPRRHSPRGGRGSSTVCAPTGPTHALHYNISTQLSRAFLLSLCARYHDMAGTLHLNAIVMATACLL